jgi:hypothetical protein
LFIDLRAQLKRQTEIVISRPPEMPCSNATQVVRRTPMLPGHRNGPSRADLYTFVISADKREAIGKWVTL